MILDSIKSEITKKLPKLPVRRILTIVVLIILGELLLIALFDLSSFEKNFQKGYLDAVFILLLVVSLLYLIVVRPTDLYIEKYRKSKEALFEREEHYRALINAGEALIWKAEPDGRCTYVNEIWLKFTGRTLEQELGNGWSEGLHPDDRQNYSDFMKDVFNKQERYSMTYRLHHVSGNYRWIQTNANPTYNSKGEFTGYIGHCLDIHEYKLAEENILQREKEYRTLFENSPMAAFFFDQEGTIIFWNKAAEKTFGWTREETIGKEMTCFFKPDSNHPEINYTLEQLLAQAEHRTVIKNYLKKDGITITCECHRTPIYGIDGKICKVIALAKDITEQKRFEQELIAAKEKAEESDRLKSAFLANMTHELRSPLNNIIGFSELLADPDYGNEQKAQFAQLINNGGKNLLNTINELMDFSKIDAGQMKVNRQPVALKALLDELQLEYSFKACEKGLKLLLDTDNDPFDFIIHTDEIKLRQVLVNLVSNALKFTSKGTIELGLRTTEDFVQLHVRDTGIGISQEYQDKIFERFLQVEFPNRRKYGGIGLGLAISKSLVELLGGNLWVESREGHGSTFYFTLPLSAAANDPEDNEKTVDNKRKSKKQQL